MTQATQTIKITPHQARDFAIRWHELTQNKAVLDFDTATLAKEVRSFFPSGGSGDHQFRKWTIKHFRISSATASKLVRAVKALTKFPKQKDWEEVGGWHSIALLASLQAGERAKVLKRCRVLRRKGRTLCYSSVRDVAFSLGVRSRNPGRPNVTESEEKLGVLRGWLRRLYDTYELDDMPKHVVEAMGSTTLGRLQDALR